MSIEWVTSEAGATVKLPDCDAVIMQFPVPAALAVSVTELPEELVPDPVHPPPEVAIETGKLAEEVAETVKVAP